MAAAKSSPARVLGKDKARTAAAADRRRHRRLDKKFSELTPQEKDDLLNILAVRFRLVKPE